MYETGAPAPIPLRLPPGKYHHTFLISYEGTNVGKIYFTDLEAAVPKDTGLEYGQTLYLDATLPDVLSSIQGGVLRYFLSPASSPAWQNRGQPLRLYHVREQRFCTPGVSYDEIGESGEAGAEDTVEGSTDCKNDTYKGRIGARAEFPAGSDDQ